MSEILKKLSSYNIFINLFPGVIFCLIVDKYLSYPLIQQDLLVSLFLYYFIGLVISRVGSLVIEPLLKIVGLLKYSDYKDYVVASKVDSKIDVLLETNNMYRSVTSLFFCISIVIGFKLVSEKYPIIFELSIPMTTIFLLFLFLFSYLKQTSYICKRVKMASVNKGGEDGDKK